MTPQVEKKSSKEIEKLDESNQQIMFNNTSFTAFCDSDELS